MTGRLDAVETHAPGARQFDARQFLALYVFLLFVIPARLVIPGTGAIGTPAALLGLVGFGWWMATTLLNQREFTARNPVRIALFCYLGVVLLSWTLGKMRVLTPLEATTSDRAILAMFGLIGVALVAMDGLRSLEEIERLVRWMMICAMVMVFVGLVQFFFKRDLSTALQIPGLELNADASEVSSRSDFNRPHGTALHAIEFGVVTAALVPLAYWMARRFRTVRSYIPVFALAFGAMASLSRSAVLACAIIVCVTIAGFGWRQRFAIIVCTTVFVVVVGTLVDGLVGTLRSLFTTAESDPSVQARIDRIPRVFELIAEYPWLGRGFGTYTPEDYFLLDNEIQKTVIESGLIGVAVLIIFIGFVSTMAWRTRVGEERTVLPGTALAATILGLFVSSYTFDAFFYRILTGVLFLCIGLTGAMYRITAAERARVDGLAPPGSEPLPAGASAERHPALTA